MNRKTNYVQLSKKLLRSEESGFTLIELLLYIALTATIVGVLSGFIILLLQARIKNQTIAEVNEQGRATMQQLGHHIRNADAINSPPKGSPSATLSLDAYNVADDPTIFDLSTGAIRIKEGAGSAIPLTNSRVTTSGLTFQNLTKGNSQGTVRVQYTITHVNPSGRNEYDYSKTFTDSFTLR